MHVRMSDAYSKIDNNVIDLRTIVCIDESTIDLISDFCIIDWHYSLVNEKKKRKKLNTICNKLMQSYYYNSMYVE